MNQGANVTVVPPPASAEAEAPIIVGLDIGTTKIAAIAGRKNELNAAIKKPSPFIWSG